MAAMAGLPSTQHVALIGNFLPRRCGLATYTTDTYKALTERFPGMRVDVYAMNDRAEGYDYPPEVTGTIAQDERAAYLAAARDIAASGAQAIWLQPAYGIFGGSAGEHILALLDRGALPVIGTLHTVLENPNGDQRRVMDGLLSRAAKVIVMAEIGREILVRVYGANPNAILMIPHGVPARPLVDPDSVKPRFGWEGRKVLLTFGLLAPGKGIECVIDAMPAIVAANPQALYVVLGATHPNLIAREGEAYRDRLKALAAEKGVAEQVHFIDGFVEHEELLDYLQAADLYVTPYTNPAQITSGTLSYAVGVGKAVVSTPNIHGAEILADGHGVIVEFGVVDAIASLAVERSSPRAQAFAMRGAAAVLGADPTQRVACNILERFSADRLALLDEARRPEWEWFEIVLAYDTARLPEALIRAGMALTRDDLLAAGLSTLDWIVAQQTSPEGRFRAIGTESFHRPYEEPLPFDQQPLEAQATIDACAAAFKATGDTHWRDEAMRAYRWYLGQNDLDLPLATAQDGGCFDGLMPNGLNRNQGAESILALQLASCAISALGKAAITVAGTGRAVA